MLKASGKNDFLRDHYVFKVIHLCNKNILTQVLNELLVCSEMYEK